MSIEREHKYLVVDESYKKMSNRHVEIKQGYLNRDPERTVRVRIKGNNAYITVKGKNDGDSRLEFEYPIPYDDALQMLNLCEPGIVEKTRWEVVYDGMLWEMDEFHGCHQGLVVAEIEIPEKDCKYSLPSFIGENVTGNPEYYNSNL